MEHHKPHHSAQFEGFYTKFDLPSGASLIIVICTVPKATRRPHLVHFTYVPHNDAAIYQHELDVSDLAFSDVADGDGFSLHTPDGQARLTRAKNSGSLVIKTSDIVFKAKFLSRKAWSSQVSTPEWLLVYLPLPLHWHVHSLASKAKFSLQLPPFANLPQEDRAGIATAHEEKNWANGFPSAHMWIQARNAGGGICLAGGKIMGMEAFLVGYRNEALGLEIDYRPPFALSVLGMSPFMSFRSDWESRTFEMNVANLAYKIKVKARAVRDSFFNLSAPTPDGHKENDMAESMKASVEVSVWKRSWPFGTWTSVCTDRFDGAALEFGGGYYSGRGKGEKTKTK